MPPRFYCRLLSAGLIGCVLAFAAPAQSVAPRAGRVRTPIRDGGTLHLATGQWARPAQAAEIPGATVFNNDAVQPFFLKAGPARRITDFGMIPSGTAAAPMVGTVDGQTIHGFQFAYSTRELRGTFGYVITFFDEQVPGIEPDERRIAARIRLMDLPGAGRVGVRANWKVTIDLRGSQHEFALGRDDEGGGAPARFAWSLVNTSNRHGTGGPILAGDPLGIFGPAAGAGQGTDWNGDPGVPGTGLGTEDGLWVEQRNLDGSPGYVTEVPNAPISYGSFHLQLYANTDQALAGDSNIGTNYCDGYTVLFEDGFESGSFAAAGWSWSGTVGIDQDSGWGGERVARMNATGTLIKEVSTVGSERVTLRYARRTWHMPPQQNLLVHWWDGLSWNLLAQTNDWEWLPRSRDLPPEAGNNPDFKIRFRNGAGTQSQSTAYIDNVRLEKTGGSHIEAFGSTSVADNDVTLVATDLPVSTFGLFFYGPAETYVPLGNGTRCVGGQPIRRLRPPILADSSGTATRALDLAVGPELTGITLAAPITMYFQYWHREAGNSNLTNALRVHFVE